MNCWRFKKFPETLHDSVWTNKIVFVIHYKSQTLLHDLIMLYVCVEHFENAQILSLIKSKQTLKHTVNLKKENKIQLQ